MNTPNDGLGRTIALPSYIFISLLLFFLAGIGMRLLWLAGENALAILSGVLVIGHVGLFWLNFLGKGGRPGWWLFYYPAQTVLMVSLALVFQTHTNNGMSFLFSATLCIVGEALAVWGNSRRSLLLGLFYFGLLFSLLFFLTERAQFYASLSGMVINGGAILFLVAMVNQQLIERQKVMDLAESLEIANARLAASTAKVESLALQNERQRMARELHDTLAQGVAGLVLQLEAVKAHLASNRTERAAAIVEHAIDHARRTLAESRAAIDDLRAAPENLAESVREKIERFTQATGIPCDVEISIQENQLPIETTNHALNILSEALTNVARHAQAKQVQVKWLLQQLALDLEIRDNGKGFDVNQQVSGHYGLVGMQERARLSGGSLNIESTAGGTCVRFIVEKLS